MRLPQVSDRIKEAPAQALRGVFAGIGQLLLITDKLRNKTPASQPVPPGRAPEPPETRADPPPAPPAEPPVAPAEPPVAPAPPARRVTEARDFDKTGNVRLITSGEVGAPLPNYGELSIASLRARLRNLDLTQVRQLAAYEKAHAARSDVVIMYERRIARLEAEASAEEDAKAEAEAREEVDEEIQAEVAAEAENEA